MNNTLTFKLGRDLVVNRMGFGTMRLTGKGIWGPPRDHKEAIQVLKKAIDSGVNFIDTADSYGPNVAEELIAEALYPYPAGLVIATKGGFLRTGPDQWKINAQPDHLRQALEGSLTRLKLDRIDLYQLHRVDPKVPFEETLEFLQDAQESGLIRHIGLSETSVDHIKKAREYVDIVSVQNMYSFDNRRWEKELQYTSKLGIAFIPWNPLNAGKLDEAGAIKKIAEKHGATVHQVALSWLFHHAPNILLIPGTSKVQHLEENLKSVDVRLDNEEIKELDGMVAA